MSAAKKVKETTTKSTKKKPVLAIVTDNQLSFDFSHKQTHTVQRDNTEKTEARLVIVHKRASTSEGLEFEGAYNEEEIVAQKLYDKFAKFKVNETVSGKFVKNSVASTFINESTIEEHIQWALMKAIEKWRQHKMIKEFNILTAPLDENVREMYHAKMKREKRISEILSYFETEVDKQSSLMEFTEFNQIWNYCFKAFNSKIRNIYRDTIKAKSNDEYVDYHTVEDCLELNADFSEHFAKDDSRAIASREVFSTLSKKVTEIDPGKAESYMKVFKACFVDGRDTEEAWKYLGMPKHTVNEMKKNIQSLVMEVRDCYEDYIEAA